MVCSEQENAYHGDSRSGVPRGGHCATAVPSLGHQVGGYAGSGLYNALGRTVFPHPTTRPSLCPGPLQSVTGPVAGVVSQHKGMQRREMETVISRY